MTDPSFQPDGMQHQPAPGGGAVGGQPSTSPTAGGPSATHPGPGGPSGVNPSAPDPSPTSPASAAPAQKAGPKDNRDTVRIVLHVLALLLVVLGISLEMGRDPLWGDTWAWAGFATLMALAQAAALLPRSTASGMGWTIGAVGAGGLLLFWTLLMLPMISTNMAFMVTLGTACAAAAVLMSPDRRV